MNASTCECQAKKSFFSKLKVSIYPFFLMMGVAIFFSLIKSNGLIKANIAPENISFGVATSAFLVIIASIFRVRYLGKGRDNLIKLMIYLSNIATDLGFGAVGFYVGSKFAKLEFGPNTVLWLLGAIFYWVLLNILHSSPVVDKIPPQYRTTLICFALPCLIFVGVFYWLYG